MHLHIMLENSPTEELGGEVGVVGSSLGVARATAGSL